MVGLGNPGKDYAGTRHNVGFEVLGGLAAAAGLPFQREKKWQAEVCRTAEGLLLLKPQTYMNLSGEAVAQLLGRYSIAPQDTMVLFDDLDLPLGMIRIRRRGTAGGHNGVKSIIGAIQTDDFVRVRMGIQPNLSSPPEETTAYLLGQFRRKELRAVSDLLDQAVDAVHMILKEGPRKAMNQFNHRVLARSKENGG